MSDHIRQTIIEFEKKLRDQEAEVSKTKQLINSLCVAAGMSARYPDSDTTSTSIFALRSDQFYGRPLATVMKEYLNMRNAANLGAATTNEIYQALCQGGYKFGAKNDENAKRGLQVSLSKNQAFHRVPSGSWGLTEWYPSVAKSQKLGDTKADEDDDGTLDEETIESGEKGGDSNG